MEHDVQKAIDLGLKEDFKRLPTKLGESIPKYNPNRRAPRNIVEYRICPYFIDPDGIQRKELKIKKHLEDVEFDIVYGVFSPSFIKRDKKSNDIYFTMLEHPVQNIYNIWSYYNFAIQKTFTKISSIEEYDKKNRWILNFIQKFPKQEDFIDFIIEHKQCRIDNYGLEFKSADYITDNTLYKNFDFIGVYDSEDLTIKSLKHLEDLFKINIIDSLEPRFFNKSSLAISRFEELNLYRKKDMIRVFKENIDYYNLQKEKLLKL
jgi:hypothetical protein